MKRFVYIVLVSFLLLSCKKEKGTIYPGNSGLGFQDVCYAANSTDQFIKTFKNIVTYSIVGPTLYFPKGRYYRPCFNPENINEIAYMLVSASPSVATGLYKFNFCTGAKTSITTDIGSDFDWGPNGWIVFSNSSLQLYKIKDNGDSLTKLSKLGGSNFDSKWSPDGSRLFYINNTIRIMDKNGNNEIIIPANPFKAIDWIDNNTLLVFKGGINKFCKFNISENAISNPICSYTTTYTDPKIFDRKNNLCYQSLNNGPGAKDYFIKYDFNNNSLDTMQTQFDSYFYGTGDYNPATNKTIIQLIRQEWKDSIKAEINYFMEPLIINPNGTKERLLKID